MKLDERFGRVPRCNNIGARNFPQCGYTVTFEMKSTSYDTTATQLRYIAVTM
jgi:hypothetical protein